MMSWVNAKKGTMLTPCGKAVTGRPVFCASAVPCNAKKRCPKKYTEATPGRSSERSISASKPQLSESSLSSSRNWMPVPSSWPNKPSMSPRAKRRTAFFDFRRASGCASTCRDSTTIAECDHPHAAVSTREPAGAAARRAATPSAMSAQRRMSLRRRRARGSLRRGAARGASAAETGGRRGDARRQAARALGAQPQRAVVASPRIDRPIGAESERVAASEAQGDDLVGGGKVERLGRRDVLPLPEAELAVAAPAPRPHRVRARRDDHRVAVAARQTHHAQPVEALHHLASTATACRRGRAGRTRPSPTSRARRRRAGRACAASRTRPRARAARRRPRRRSASARGGRACRRAPTRRRRRSPTRSVPSAARATECVRPHATAATVMPIRPRTRCGTPPDWPSAGSPAPRSPSPWPSWAVLVAAPAPHLALGGEREHVRAAARQRVDQVAQQPLDQPRLSTEPRSPVPSVPSSPFPHEKTRPSASSASVEREPHTTARRSEPRKYGTICG